MPWKNFYGNEDEGKVSEFNSAALKMENYLKSN